MLGKLMFAVDDKRGETFSKLSCVFSNIEVTDSVTHK